MGLLVLDSATKDRWLQSDQQVTAFPYNPVAVSGMYSKQCVICLEKVRPGKHASIRWQLADPRSISPVLLKLRNSEEVWQVTPPDALCLDLDFNQHGTLGITRDGLRLKTSNNEADSQLTGQCSWLEMKPACV